MEERRGCVRVGLSVTVKWRTPEDSAACLPQKKAQSRNISVIGICLVLREPVEIGGALEMEFMLPGGSIIHANGKVIWLGKFDAKEDRRAGGTGAFNVAGIKFLDISEADRKEIADLIIHRLSRGQQPLHENEE
jgi:c-di-GMP-binding flagellar brake protein YcgR